MKRLKKIQEGLPVGVSLVPYYEQAELVSNATGTVKSAFLQEGLLVVLVLILFMGNWRTAFIVALSLPICALTAIIFMDLNEISANLMSLGGIAIAIGMLGDGSIVMIENIYRHMGQKKVKGESRGRIILTAAREVGRPILFSIIIIILVFLPLFTLEGIEGKMLSPMAFTIAFALLGSLLFALLVAPVMSLYLIKPEEHKEIWLVKIFSGLYRPMLTTVFRFKKAVILLPVFSLAISIGFLKVIGTEFIPTLEEGSILIGVSMAPTISLEEGIKTVMNLERKILEFTEIEETISRIGRPEAGSHPHPVNTGEIHLELKSRKEWKNFSSKADLINTIRKKISVVPGIQFNFTQPIQNSFDELLSGVKTYLALKLFGEDLSVLRMKSEEIKEAIEDIPGLVDLSNEQNFGQPQIQVVADREACARYGVSVSRILEMVELAVGGEVVDYIYFNTRRSVFICDIRKNIAVTLRPFATCCWLPRAGVWFPLARLQRLKL
jgi:cobalt-zinc-cadmium resistance protein CzcA